MYVCRFAQQWEDFRIPELEAVAKIQNVSVSFNPLEYTDSSPFLKIQLSDDFAVQKILDRAILVKDIIELWHDADTLEKLHEKVKGNLESFAPYAQVSFKFLIKSYGKAYSPAEQVAIINSFAYTELQGPIKMNDQDIIFTLFVDRVKGRPEHYYFGRYVGRSLRGKHLIAMDLKTREYLGTTSMDAELSLVMSNMGLAKSGSLIYDPFVGTGSFLYTCSYFGAYTLGSDIDGRQMRGKPASSCTNRGPKYKKATDLYSSAEELPSIFTNVLQYGLDGKVLDCLVFDISHNPWSDKLSLTAIVCDPPYGVRAGAKKLGAATLKDSKPIPLEFRPITYPVTQPYALDEMTRDLQSFAVKTLQSNGRLVFWYPVEADNIPNFKLETVTTHPILKLVAAS